ncbi:MAG TPA: right-handed parallel beta-helix repeat-containing protein [Candidatus Elarobacter sp.]|jgi:hypothetical protein|nr:right-handed parallel beta-helix repeat-containing protein [Candidatus Elarobacter sp.]
MRRAYWVFLTALAVGFCALTGAAQAQATRTWVSGVGDDANPCSRTAPCKTFAGAISKTANCGEMDALDPGGFGTVTITKSMTIDGGGGQAASILAAGVPGISIVNSDTVCRAVIIRNLRITGGNSTSLGTIGINITSSQAGAVSIENVQIDEFSSQCVYANASQAQLVNVVNSTFEFCQTGGLVATSPVATDKVNVFNSVFAGDSVGITIHGNTLATVLSSQIVNNTTGGVLADTGSSAKLDIDRSQISNNLGYGVQATAGAVIDLSNDSVLFNLGQGLYANGGTINTWSNNYVNGNNPDGSRSATLTPM